MTNLDRIEASENTGMMTNISLDVEGLTRFGIAISLVSFAAIDGIYNGALRGSFDHSYLDVLAIMGAYVVAEGFRDVGIQIVRRPLREALGQSPIINSADRNTS